MLKLQADTPLALALVEAVRGGDTPTLATILEGHPGLASSVIEERRSAGSQTVGRSLLHVLTDWPGNFPNGAATVALLVNAGADVNARFVGNHEETPLHWAASCDDVAVLDALLNHGADIEARGGVIGGGTPLADAVAFAQWNAARRLVERGATTTLWQAAALGLLEQVTGHFSGKTPPDTTDITNAFWCACHGGQREAAEFLLQEGADLNWKGYDNLSPLDAARRAGAGELAAWLSERGAASALGKAR
jgi:ankyrin repeat protein